MKHYIDKSALVAEIESKKNRAQILGDNAINSSMQQFYDGMKQGCVDILSFINTLKVKEVQEEPVIEDFEKIVEEIVEPTILNAYGAKELARRLRNTICGTSVSEDLEESAEKAAADAFFVSPQWTAVGKELFKAGAEWQKNHLWRNAQIDDLPDIDRGVIVLTRPYPLGENEYIVSFAHRPNPNGRDGKSITTGNIEHYTPKTYDKGGWNIPNIMYWLDVELPKY